MVHLVPVRYVLLLSAELVCPIYEVLSTLVVVISIRGNYVVMHPFMAENTLFIAERVGRE